MKYRRIADYLKFEFLEKYEINQNQLAVALNVEPNRVSEIVRSRRRITPNTDLRLCKFFELEGGHFLDIQNDMELSREKEFMSEELEKIIPYSKVR